MQWTDITLSSASVTIMRRGSLPRWLAAAGLTLLLVGQLRAQQPPPSPPGSRYQPPTIALVLPPPEGAIPADRPVVVFHFSAGLAPGQTGDPIDLASFRAWVDGIDRSASFKVDTEDAWGALAPMGSASSGAASVDSSGAVPSPSIAVGVHLVTARLCSMRGVCGELHALVTVLPGADPTHAAAAIQAEQAMQAPASAATAHQSLGRKLIGALANGLRKLFTR